MRKIAKVIGVAFSMYSKIPMPHFVWASEDMRYHLLFFPWIGAVIGGLEIAWYRLAGYLGVGKILSVALAVFLPLFVTGGFHMDGFMDTKDALSSYQGKEKKLEILKDPHIGAFAVIHLLSYLLLALGFASVIEGTKAVVAVSAAFFLSRCLSGLSVIHFPGAKKEGSLYTEADTSGAKVVSIGLVIQMLLVVTALFIYSGMNGILVTAACLLMFLYYYLMSRRQFGGITGDLAGYFVCMAELWSVIVVGIYLVLK